MSLETSDRAAGPVLGDFTAKELQILMAGGPSGRFL